MSELSIIMCGSCDFLAAFLQWYVELDTLPPFLLVVCTVVSPYQLLES